MMGFLSDVPHLLVSFLLFITVLVFVHELGHFLVARWCGIRVDVFSIGFGPELIGWTDRRGTRWKFSALPLGGYVKMFGDSNIMSLPDGTERPMTSAEANPFGANLPPRKLSYSSTRSGAPSSRSTS